MNDKQLEAFEKFSKLKVGALFEDKEIGKIAAQNAKDLRAKRMSKEENLKKYGKFKKLRGEEDGN